MECMELSEFMEPMQRMDPLIPWPMESKESRDGIHVMETMEDFGIKAFFEGGVLLHSFIEKTLDYSTHILQVR